MASWYYHLAHNPETQLMFWGPGFESRHGQTVEFEFNKKKSGIKNLLTTMKPLSEKPIWVINAPLGKEICRPEGILNN